MDDVIRFVDPSYAGIQSITIRNMVQRKHVHILVLESLAEWFRSVLQNLDASRLAFKLNIGTEEARRLHGLTSRLILAVIEDFTKAKKNLVHIVRQYPTATGLQMLNYMMEVHAVYNEEKAVMSELLHRPDLLQHLTATVKWDLDDLLAQQINKVQTKQ